MKKIFTLLLSLTTFASAFAQFGQNDRTNNGNGKDYSYNDDRNRKDKGDDDRYKKHDKDWNDRGYYFSRREMEMEISQINRKYDRKIESVKSNWYLPRFKKERIVCDLQDQRKDEIKSVYAKFNDRRNHFNDRGPGRHW